MSREWNCGRFYCAIAGYRLRYQTWPIEVRVTAISLELLRASFDEQGWAALNAKLRLVRVPDNEPRAMQATNGGDSIYDYWVDGCPKDVPDIDPKTWLGVMPTFPRFPNGEVKPERTV